MSEAREPRISDVTDLVFDWLKCERERGVVARGKWRCNACMGIGLSCSNAAHFGTHRAATSFPILTSISLVTLPSHPVPSDEVQNVHIETIRPIISPALLLEEAAATPVVYETVKEGRKAVRDLVHGR